MRRRYETEQDDDIVDKFISFCDKSATPSSDMGFRDLKPIQLFQSGPVWNEEPSCNSKLSEVNVGGFSGLSTLDLVSGTSSETGVTPIKFTSLGEKKNYRFDGHAINQLKSPVQLIPMMSPVTSRLSEPAILRGRKRKHKSHRRGRVKKKLPYKTERPRWQSIVENLDRQTFTELSNKENLNPVKNLFKQYQDQPLQGSCFSTDAGVEKLVKDVVRSTENVCVSDKNNMFVGGFESKQCKILSCDDNSIETDDDAVLTRFDSGLGASTKDCIMGSEGDSDPANKQMSLTPKGTPIKNLPFSPSQFLNSPEIPYGKMTSTPVCSKQNSSSSGHGSILNTPDVKVRDSFSRHQTPVVSKSLLQATPRTPTPFKNALELMKRSQSHKISPVQLADVEAVIREDTGYEADMSTTEFVDTSNVVTDSNRVPTGNSVRVRQSLQHKWPARSTNSIPDPESLLLSPETPSKSLLGDTSILFSPPSIIKDTLPDEEFKEAFNPQKKHQTILKPSKKSMKKIQFSETPTKQKKVQLNAQFEKVACGKTPDQLLMTELARSITKVNLKPRSLHLE